MWSLPRAVWNQTWVAYVGESYSRKDDYYRILLEGFYPSELDGWRPAEREIRELRQRLIDEATRQYAYIE